MQTQIEYVINSLKKSCKETPPNTCIICYRLLFRNQVKMRNISKYPNENLITHSIEQCAMHETRPECIKACRRCAKWICHTCDRNLKKIPNQALLNNMSLQPLPQCLTELNQLEKTHLITPVILFIKILLLPKGQQKGVHGLVVCVPANLSKITEILPHQLSDSTLVKVKLKRKLEYRGYHLFQQVSAHKLKSALSYLKANNPHFSGNSYVLERSIFTHKYHFFHIS